MREALDELVPRRGVLAAAAWAAPTLAVATAAPAIAASSPIDPQSDLSVAALGGAEGLYATGHPYTSSVVGSNTDFRRAFSVTNSGDGSFTGSLRIDFTFPRMWNQAREGGDTDAFRNWSTQDLGGTGGGSIGGSSAWAEGARPTEYTENTGNDAWTDVWLLNVPAHFTLMEVPLRPARRSGSPSTRPSRASGSAKRANTSTPATRTTASTGGRP